jgi:DNA helicase-2/ATP-dependent DNA helicase PcrA
VIKRLLTALEVDEKKWPPRQVQSFINTQKDEGLRAAHIADNGDFYQKNMLRFYTEYEAICNRSSLVDFAELLLRCHELLRDNIDLLNFYRNRFRQVHVDEFQDTNTIQYAWLRLLTEGKDNLFVVGDDDQSIYGWRGAKIANLLHFQKHYPNHQVIRLEQNYRSTGHILNAANHLIAHNENRMGKQLWTDSGEGQLISLYTAFNEQDEAFFVIEQIKKWREEGGLGQEVAILYRSNAQSRLFEERLMTFGIPYRVYGGLRFFERAEIKNTLAYLRLMANRHDDPSFERVINLPTRGIGLKTLEDIRQLARSQQQSLWHSALALLNQHTLSARATNALNGFLLLIKSLADTAQTLALHDKVKLVVEHSGLLALYKKDKDDQGEARVENLEELVNAAGLFDYQTDNEENLSELDMFLAHACLEAGEMQVGDGTDCVQLMTLHTSKGLEFKKVFLVGLEEGLFPSEQSLYNPERLEEERRLCYVGITRAMQQLFISHAESRRLYGQEHYPTPSRFLREIPVELMQEIRIRAQITRPASVAKAKAADSLKTNTYKAGQKVSHAKFGVGVVLQTEGEGTQEKVQINFKTEGMKWLMLAYAKLEVLS